MFRTLLTTALLAATGVAAAESARPDADLIREMRAEAQAFAKAGPSAADVGDASSFGRTMKFAGVLQTGTVVFRHDCSLENLGAEDRCITIDPAPALTTFSVTDIGRVNLPARSAHSLLCHWVSPILFYSFGNGTTARQTAQLRLTPSLRIESAVLQDPTLIDPLTGLPYGGAMEIGLSGAHNTSRTMDPGESESGRRNDSRVCIAGVLSKANLEAEGFTPAQADALLRQPMTIRFNLSGSSRMLTDATVLYGVRFMAD